MVVISVQNPVVTHQCMRQTRSEIVPANTHTVTVISAVVLRTEPSYLPTCTELDRCSLSELERFKVEESFKSADFRIQSAKSSPNS